MALSQDASGDTGPPSTLQQALSPNHEQGEQKVPSFELRIEFPCTVGAVFNAYGPTQEFFTKMLEEVPNIAILSHDGKQQFKTSNTFPTAKQFDDFFHYGESKLVRSHARAVVVFTLQSEKPLYKIKADNKPFFDWLRATNVYTFEHSFFDT